MKVALLISGYLRSLNLNLDCIQEKILSKFDSVDVFLHLTKDEHTKDKYYNDIQQKDIDKIKNILNPLVTLEENTVSFYFDKKQNDVFNTWFKYYKLNKIKKEYEKNCSELHSYMNKIEKVNPKKFQELVGRIEVLGELLIANQQMKGK